MPADFMKCVKDGGKVVTKQLKGGRTIKICYDKKGKSHVSEIKTKKKPKSKATMKQKEQRHKARAKKDKKLLNNSKVIMKDLLRLKDHFDKNYRAER